MKNLYRAAWALAAYIGFCGLIHLPYYFLTRAGVIERSAEMTNFTTIITGPMICIAEVVFFIYMLTKIKSANSMKGAIFTLMTVPAVSAVARIGNFASRFSDGKFAEIWGAYGGVVNNISTIFDVIAIVALVWLGLCLRRGSMVRIMSFVAAYDCVFTFVVWSLLAPAISLPGWLHPVALIQFYIVWILFYVAFAKYYKPQN